MSGTQDYRQDIFSQSAITALLDGSIITIDTLSNITGIPVQWFRDFITDIKSYDVLTYEERVFLFQTLVMLTYGFDDTYDADRQLEYVAHQIVDGYGISTKTVSKFARVSPSEVRSFLSNTKSVGWETKYSLGVTMMMLFYAFKKADYEHEKKQLEYVNKRMNERSQESD